MSITPSFGQSGYGPTVIEAIPNKFPKYTVSFIGDISDVNTSASVYAALGWDTTVVPGNPAVMTAFIQCELGADGKTPISSSGAYNTVNWSFHYDITEKSILHCNPAYVPWVTQLTETQVNILEKCLSDPPTGSLFAAYPQFDTATGSSGSPPPAFSGSTAGDVIWWMAQDGFRTIPIPQPILRYSATVGSGFNLTNYVSNLYSYYSATSLNSTWGVQSNFAAVVSAIYSNYTDPDPTTTNNIPYFYGWQKMPPTIEQNGITTNVQMEFRFGLYPENIYGTRL